MTNQASLKFMFQPQELPKKLSHAKLNQALHDIRTGYWQIQLTPSYANSNKKLWYLAVVQGRIVFSGTQNLSWTAVLKNLQRYVSGLRSSSSKQAVLTLEQESTPEDRDELLSKMIGRMEKLSLLSRQDVIQALQLQILSDFDAHLFNGSGQAQFIPDHNLVSQTPITGFKLDDLIVQAEKRQEQWNNLQPQILSMQGIPILNPEAVERSNIPMEQKQRIHKLTNQGKALDNIANDLAQDPLEIAKVFAKLVRSGFVTMKLPPDAVGKALRLEVFIVDDSPIFLGDFQKLVTKWGYRVNFHTNATTAVQKMLESKPAIIFLDINMPGASGFDLIKEIRRQPKLASLPVVLLTAENSLSNQWRAKWGSCQFLAKARTPTEIQTFHTELRSLLKATAPL